MRRTLTLLTAVAAVALATAVPASADAAATDTGSGTLSMKVKVTSFEATKRGIVANGTLIGRLRSGSEVVRDTAPVRFRVMQQQGARRCDVLTLRLAPLFLELLGARVETSHISLDVYARRGPVLGDLFCALSRAEVSFPRVAEAMNKRLDGRPLRVAATRVPVTPLDHQGTCQVLRLVLGPLHLDLLGLVVDLYGRTRQDPVVVTITAVPGHGLLGDLLCAVAGGGGITSLAQLQSLLQSLGVNISDADLQNLLNSLGIDLADGLSVLELQQILEALGLRDAPVAP
jgi:hypothetical protein